MSMQASLPFADLTPKHVRAARALLAWSQQDLAKQAGVATSTIADFERGHRTPVANNAQAIRGALENAGIRFLPAGAVIGPPIPHIVGSERSGAPIRWVDAKDLADWADRLDGAASLPTLLAHLIRATHGAAIDLRFPSDEGIRHPGWDGRTIAEQEGPYVPQGEAGWEVGSQRSAISQKATSDYEKRTAQPAPLDPAVSTYIFVTPRHWPRKDEWSKARRAEGPWRDVRAYDADDLVHWIEQTPAVGQWLATRLGKRPPGTRQLEEVWDEWSLATKWPLTEDLVLSDRDEDAAEVLRWLRDEPSVLSIQATTTEEAAAFFHATLKMLPEGAAADYRARCLVATDATAARALANARPPLILVLTEPDPGLAHSLAKRGHFVLQAYDDRPVGRGEVRKLARPSREGITSVLTDAGIPETRARSLARDSARNLAILRRLIPSAPGRLPDWAKEPPPRALLAALLAGGWDDGSEADKAKLAELAGEPYDQAISTLTRYVGEFDRPLRKIGSTWRIASPPDAWMLLARYLTRADIGRFEAMAHEVLGTADPRYDMEPTERWMAGIRGLQPEYSGLLRHGVGEVLILVTLWGTEIRTVPDNQRRADAIVGKLLRDADQRRWWSLSHDFRLLAEASPSAFLGAIEDSLDQSDPPIRVLFGTDEGGMFGTEHLSDLLWALDSLAWSPELLPRVSLVLARLDAIDNPPGRYLNRPGNSLRQIHLLWQPQTFAPLDQRLRTLDLIRKVESDAAWKLMLGVLPRGHDSSHPSATPRWRDFTADKPEVVTWALIGRGAAAVSERLLADAGTNVPRWLTLLDRLRDIAPNRDPAIDCLEKVEPQIKDEADRASLRTGLRKLLHHHRQFPDVEWSLPAPELGRLEAIYERLAPADAVERVAWLFDQAPGLPNPSHEGWQAEERQVNETRRQAARDVYAARGVAGILGLAGLVSTAGYIGKALFEAGLDDAGLDALLEASLRSDNPRERDVGHGLIVTVFRERKEPWARQLIAKAREQDWGDIALLAILRALPQQRWTWDQAVEAGQRIDEAYWRSAPVLWVDGDAEEIAYAARKLIAVGRARHAVHLAGREREKRLPSALLVEALTEAVRQSFESDGDTNEPTMFQHHVAELLQQLDERTDVSNETLVTLEWAYLPLLQYSPRPAKVLLKALAEQPALFIQMLSAVFKPSEESGVVEPEPTDPERASAVANQAFRLLELWDRLPGTRDDGTIEANALEAWIKEARSLAKAAGREDVADSRIGTVLSASPMGADGFWPAEAVREVIDLFRSRRMIDGFWMGRRNRRGVTTRMPRDGGQLERKEAAKYRRFAEALAYEHPQTAKALNTLADSYENEARHHDDDAQRLDWEA
jgi:transcriptional regulator with XRE-family HTH domain